MQTEYQIYNLKNGKISNINRDSIKYKLISRALLTINANKTIKVVIG